MQAAICIYWFQMPISSSSGSALCYINKSQPSGPQQATLKYVPTPCKSIKSKYKHTEFCLTENWIEHHSPQEAVWKKKCSLGIRT